jgi:hypothetical protein
MESDSEFERRQEEAAASEAARIGGEPGKVPGYDDDPTTPGISSDPARQPVEEAGGGEAEGFEQAEEQLREHAEHGEPAPDPSDEAFPTEAESDREAGGARGEPDQAKSSERTGDA